MASKIINIQSTTKTMILDIASAAPVALGALLNNKADFCGASPLEIRIAQAELVKEKMLRPSKKASLVQLWETTPKGRRALAAAL